MTRQFDWTHITTSIENEEFKFPDLRNLEANQDSDLLELPLGFKGIHPLMKISN